MNQKVFLKLYVKGKIRPLFTCEIVDNVENTIKSLDEKLNDRNLSTVTFGQVSFWRTDFRYYIIVYK